MHHHVLPVNVIIHFYFIFIFINKAEGVFKDELDKLCYKCITNCKTCANLIHCEECFESFAISEDKTVCFCPDNSTINNNCIIILY